MVGCAALVTNLVTSQGGAFYILVARGGADLLFFCLRGAHVVAWAIASLARVRGQFELLFGGHGLPRSV